MTNLHTTTLRSTTRLRSLLPAVLLQVLCFLTLCFLTPALGQGSQAAPAVFQETVDVRVMNLEAAVTHKRGADRGEHVDGLVAEDFVLKVDGDRIPIEYFTEVRGGVAVDHPMSAGSPNRAQASASVPAFPAGDPVATRILIFVDNYFSIAARRDAVLRRLSDQLLELGPHTYLAVVSYGGTAVKLVSSWTRDHEEIRRALRSVSDQPAYGLHRRSEFARLQNLSTYGAGRTGERGATSSGLSASSSFSSIGFRGARREPGVDPQLGLEVSGQVSRVALAATSALRGFARPEGRKVLLLLSGGLPAIGDVGAVPEDGELGSYGFWWSDLRGDRRLLAPLVDTANRLGYSIYPVDLGTSAAAAALHSAADATSADSQRRRNFQRELNFFSQDALLFLARSTGGEAYLDSSRFVALHRLLDDTRSYYWIGFTPTWREDDGLHRVELTTQRGGVKVRTRDSFSDLSRSSVVSLQVESAQLFDSPLSTTAASAPHRARLKVAAGQAVRSGLGRMVVPLRLTLPLDRLTLLPSPNADGWQGRAEIRIVASDDDGEVSPMPVLEVELTTDAKPVAGAVQVYETTLELRRRPHRVLVAVYDPLTGELFGEQLRVEP